MGLEVKPAPLMLSEYTRDDSEDNAMLKNHAYRAQSPGVVYAYVQAPAGNDVIVVLVGLTSDPAGEGLEIQRSSCDAAASAEWVCVTAQVAKGEYFEILSTGGTPNISWKSYGPLKKPIDFN